MLDFKNAPAYPQGNHEWKDALNEIEVSVIVCTWNRSGRLRGALETLLCQDFSRNRYEIIVVDNGSTDSTPDVLRDLNDAGAGLILLREDRLGVGHARNKGRRAAKGTILVFFDDDCRADNRWLRNLYEALRNQPAEVACVGGVVRPIWSGSRPRWLADSLLSYLGMQDWGPSSFNISPGQWLCSNNLAVRAAALEAVGGFRVDLGRRGNWLLDGAETELEQLFMESGFICRYDPAPVVHHLVDPERMSVMWFFKRTFWGGASARWAAGGPVRAGTRRGAVKDGRRALRRFDVPALICTFVRMSGFVYAAFRNNPNLPRGSVS